MNNNSSFKVIYLLGAGHCGSTLLDMIMGAHSKIVGVGELENVSSKEEKLKNLLCACGKKASECSFWSQVLAGIDWPNGLGVYRKKIDFLLDRKNYVFRNKSKDAVLADIYLNLNRQLYKKILEISGKEIVFDSSKYADRLELLLSDKNLDIIILHLVRDGRGVMWSYKKKYGGVFSPIWRWLGRNLKIEIVKRRAKGVRIIFVRYEDLVKDPQKELEKILAKIGLKFEPQMLNFRNSRQHQIAGNRMRFGKSAEIKEDLSWKENLSRFDLFVFNLFAGWLNRIYKY